MKSGNSERGAAVVEFAVMFLLLLVFALGIIDFGILWVQSHYITNAAREGGRVASKIGDLSTSAAQTEIKTAVETYLTGIYKNLNGSQVNLTYGNSFPGSSKFVEILVTAGSLNDFTDPDITSPPDAVEVQVKVQTAETWTPVLWDILDLLPGSNITAPREISKSAVFTKAPE